MLTTVPHSLVIPRHWVYKLTNPYIISVATVFIVSAVKHLTETIISHIQETEMSFLHKVALLVGRELVPVVQASDKVSWAPYVGSFPELV